jgi:enediyne biosynthesis protein E4
VAGLCWLLGTLPLPGLDWQAGNGFRWANLEVQGAAQPGFTLLSPEATGLNFTNQLAEIDGAANRVLYNGSGVATGDFDNDGLPDIFLCNLSGSNALYRNLGNWRFKDVTVEAGLGDPLPLSRGAVFADINGDGFLDLLVSVTGRGVVCFLNDGQGHFTNVTAAAGTSGKYGSTTMTLADIDGKGALDLYIANYRTDDIRDRGRVNMNMVHGRPVLAGSETNRFLLVNGQLVECGQPDQLLLNDGAGHFKPVSWTDGTFLDEDGNKLSEAPLDWGLSAAFRDVNDDLAPDLYVCNDYWTPDRFWINDGRGHFRAAARQALRKTSASSMGVAFSDINRAGHVDFFVVDMMSRDARERKRQGFSQTPVATPAGVLDDRPQVMRNTLFLNRGDGTFGEIAFYAHVAASDWSWAPLFMDVDLDGYEDLLIGAGHFRDVQDYDAETQIGALQHAWTGFKNNAELQKAFTRELMEHDRLYPALDLPIVAYRNQGDCTFTEVTEKWGLNRLGVHQGVAAADFDQDGDLDLIVNNLNSPAMLFRNEAGAGRVAVRLKGLAGNTQGIGAKITLWHGAVSNQTTEITCGGQYQSGSDTEAVFATGAMSNGMTLEVRWRNGSRSLVEDVRRNRVYEIDERGAHSDPVTPPAKDTPVFEDASQLLSHQHHQMEFDDYQRQPLLPFKLSQLGPGVAWFDLDGDGHDDLIIGSAFGGAPALFRSDGQGHFTPIASDPALTVPNDTMGLVGWEDGDGGRGVLAGLSGYEFKSDHGAMSMRLAGDRLTAGDALAADMASASVLALGDMNGDGRMALFIGGGVIPGRYPMGAPSELYQYDGHEWKPDERNNVLFGNLGIVNGAVWSDLNGDGFPELVVACEWGPIRVFQRREGGLHEITKELGLDAYTGWWRGVTTGDLENNGKMDIIAANWGLNSPYRASKQEPLVFAYGELFQPGVMDLLETEYVGGALTPTRQFKALATSLPFLRERFSTHKAYSEASLDEVLGDRTALAKQVSATTLASMAFLNTGRKFNPVPLPREAQFAPAFSVNVADFDGDGNEDVFLSQNFFDQQPEATRIDAGLGLWLQGDGAGGLKAVPAARSGVRVYGEQRGAALGDYDEDGRVDLVVTQNGAATKLYHNVGARPGLRVKLKGLPGNPAGINAVLRLIFKDHKGPAREIHAGSGYCSEDSLTQVMATPEKPVSIWVRWPGGRVMTTPIPDGAREIVIDTQGKVVSNK